MAEALKVAIAGLGTVGAGLVRLLQAQHDVIAARSGRSIEITAVAARDKTKDRGCDLGGYAWYEDAAEMARDADADVIVELIGGSEGIAKETCEAAFAAGRHVVTANKALIAHHGLQLAGAAEQAGVTLAYEAAVAGGIPVIKSIREGLAGNRITSLHGILNGTCNYILTAMRETGRDFDDVLSEAQELGYAEADPSFDVDGVDAAHKLAILTSLAFGVEIDFKSVSVEGIRHITPDDLQYAREIGYKIKLLGIAEQGEQGVFQRVHPVMVPMSAPIASVEGVFNAVVTKGDFVDTTVMEGRGAGDGPTASAVAADIIDIAAGRGGPAFGVPVSALRKMPTLPLDSHVGTYYVRLVVIDQPGVMADITAILRDESISLENVIQRGRDPGAPVTVVLTTHETGEAAMQAARAKIEALGAVVETPRMIRIEPFEG
ncbi:homoserine dehydrogenase [Hwanghaeella grinnelliae]|uniref:Homoserine dehydrogenase n=1 Tax=Hwanghaeella grinnelliae TaxID=2500179 RepID=A0A3S2VQW3_9PROT|nr:homoserine dehydrogenase [Hwanghaeella grinnelliae]RVU39484.1 homoserine dehydrogenase [Hwanghaeella grinnelliae]